MSFATIVIYWTLVVLAAFAFALALQMRMMIGIALRRALSAGRLDLHPSKANAAISWAAGNDPLPEEAEDWLVPMVAKLRSEFSRPLSHLRIARRWCLIAPLLLMLLGAMGRFRLGLF